MPAPPLPTSKGDDRRTSPSKRSSSPRRRTPRSASEAAASASRTKSYDSPTRSISSKASVAASIESRSRNPGGTSRRASLSLGGTDHSRSSRRSATDSGSRTEQKKVNRPGTVSPFLKNTHRDLKQQIAVLQGHIKFIQDLAVMKDHKKVDLLFQMIDRDGGGTVDAEELATAMRQNDELSFSDSIEKAIDMVATFDINGDGELDRAEFLNYVTAMVQELGVSISDFSEFLVVQLLLSQETPEEKLAGELAREHINEEVKKREELFAALSNDQVTELFEMFDKGSSGEIPFQKVAKSLYQCTRNEGKAVHEALAVLLMIDMNDTRMLDYEQFGRLILAVSKTTGKSLEDTSDDLMNALDSQSAWDANAGFELMVSNDGTSVFDGGSVRDGNNEPIDALTYGRLKKLFKLWDTDGDGDISVTELADGLRKFQNASGIKVDADALAQALISFDEDGDNQLDPREFAKAMILYAQQFGVELHSLIDFMCSSSSTGSNSKAFKEEPPTFGKPAFEVDFWD